MLKFKHASQSQAQYMIRLAFVSALYMSLEQQYRNIEGKRRIKDIIHRDLEYTQKLFNLGHGQFNREELDEIQKRIDIIFKNKYEEVDSAQVYISSMIGLVSEMLTEMPEKSKKYEPLEILLKRMEGLYDYFAFRTRQPRFDEEGLLLMNLINYHFFEG